MNLKLVLLLCSLCCNPFPLMWEDMGGLGMGPVVESLPSMCEVTDLSLSLEGAERSEREEKLAVWKVDVIFNTVQI